MSVLLTADGLISLLTLTLLEIVLGIDNIIFISILAVKLPPEQQGKARTLGILLALVVRVALLFAITWIISLQQDLFTLFEMGFSGRDLILLGGGLFLIGKSTSEIHGKLQGAEHDELQSKKPTASFRSVVIQIVLIDIVFSFDSILTAVGLVQHIEIMIIAVIISLLVMLAFAKTISDFVDRNPSIKMLALSFLIMIGTLLVAEAFEYHVPKGYIYFSMAFSLSVEVLNMRFRKKSSAVALKKTTFKDIEE
jgi:predicted tellurium resistance membrane protein TerC